MYKKHVLGWAFGAVVAFSVSGCASEVSEEEAEELGETSEAWTGAGVRVTNPNNASYSNVDEALASWGSWACMVRAGDMTRDVSAKFRAKAASLPRGTRVFWMVYGKYVNGGNKCVASYSVTFSPRRISPPVIPLDSRNRPEAGYLIGTVESSR